MGSPGQKKASLPHLLAAHLLLVVLVAAVLAPGQKATAPNLAFLAGIALWEMLYLYKAIRHPERSRAATDIGLLVWAFLLVWELFTTKLNRMHPVLVPAPEDVFNVFAAHPGQLLEDVAASLGLLAAGLLPGVAVGVLLGLFAGWIPRLRGIFFPMAQVLAPIPPVIYAPYLIALMPSFRSASALVIFLGIFWPTFLRTIIQVDSTEPKILNLARTLNVGNWAMIPKILLPSVLPSVVDGLKVTLSTSIMLLCFAEMMGATKGMGYFIINNIHYANYTNVVAGILLVGIVVTVLNAIVETIRIKTIRWQ